MFYKLHFISFCVLLSGYGIASTSATKYSEVHMYLPSAQSCCFKLLTEIYPRYRYITNMDMKSRHSAFIWVYWMKGLGVQFHNMYPPYFWKDKCNWTIESKAVSWAGVVCHREQKVWIRTRNHSQVMGHIHDPL